MPIIRKSNMSDIPAIKDLWKTSFGDSDDYIDLFIKNRFKAENCALLEENGTLVGMAHLLPCTLNPGKEALYFYAVCIREDMRNRGYFRYLVTNLLKESQKRGFLNLCVPVPGLEKAYEKFGFKYQYTASETVIKKNRFSEQSVSVKIESAVPSDFLSLFSEDGGVNWDLDAIEYAFKENTFCQGRQLKTNICGKSYPFFAINKGEYFQIDYHNFDLDLFKKIANEVMDILKCEKIVLRHQGNEKIIGLADSNFVDEFSKISMILG